MPWRVLGGVQKFGGVVVCEAFSWVRGHADVAPVGCRFAFDEVNVAHDSNLALGANKEVTFAGSPTSPAFACGYGGLRRAFLLRGT